MFEREGIGVKLGVLGLEHLLENSLGADAICQITVLRVVILGVIGCYFMSV